MIVNSFELGLTNNTLSYCERPPCHCERSEAIHQNHIKRLLRTSQ